MSELAVTLIDVGWGDSILVESTDAAGITRYGLVDCNDWPNHRSALLFVKRLLERRGLEIEDDRPHFEWMVLTHAHADHARGMTRMMSTFWTSQFWYPKSVKESAIHGYIVRYANRYDSVGNHQAIESGKDLDSLVDFGDVSLSVLWPDDGQIDEDNENNNSVVLALTLEGVSFALTGDSEAENWPAIAPRLPDNLRVFQVPHHGGRNGVFTPGDETPWLDHLEATETDVALSSHIRPFGHPHPDVVAALAAAGFAQFRTDLHYHVRFSTNGADVATKFWH